jgi:hypothetical protein
LKQDFNSFSLVIKKGCQQLSLLIEKLDVAVILTATSLDYGIEKKCRQSFFLKLEWDANSYFSL